MSFWNNNTAVIPGAKVKVCYKDYNCFGTLLKSGGKVTSLVKQKDAKVGAEKYKGFNDVAESYTALMTDAGGADLSVSLKPSVGSSIYNYYLKMVGAMHTAFDNVDSLIAKSVAYDATAGALIGITDRYFVNFGESNIKHADLLLVVARLFGYGDATTFSQHAQKLAIALKEENQGYGGVIYGKNGFAMMPFILKCSGTATMSACAIIDGEGNVSIWVSNISSAYMATNFVGADDATSVISIFGMGSLYKGNNNKTKNLIKIVFDLVLLAACAVGAFFLSRYMFTTIPIVGTSMEPTIHNGDTVLIYKPKKNYEYGDVIVFNTHQANSNGSERYLIKRIIGMPGDTVDIICEEDGKYYVYVNGEKLIEDYVKDEYSMTRGMARMVVPEGKFLYMGDNRRDSYDSRSSGTFGDFDDILGLVIIRYQNGDDGLDMGIVKGVDD